MSLNRYLKGFLWLGVAPDSGRLSRAHAGPSTEATEPYAR